MRVLRERCPWKSEQTHRSLARYLLEETHETLELLDASDAPSGPDDERLVDELGDLLLQVYFHAAIAAERGAFDIDDVATAITAKMHRRNPHVFGRDAGQSTDVPGAGAGGGSAAAVDAAWQQIKDTEGPASALPETLPALLLAAKTLERRARAGAPAPHPGAELGDRLLELVAEAVALGVDPEQELRDAVRRLSGGA